MDVGITGEKWRHSGKAKEDKDLKRTVLVDTQNPHDCHDNRLRAGIGGDPRVQR